MRTKLLRTMTMAATLMLVGGCQSGGCGVHSSGVDQVPPNLSVADQIRFNKSFRKQHEDQAIDILRRSSNWQDLEAVSDDAFSGQFHSYSLARVIDKVDPSVIINGQPKVDHLKEFDFDWKQLKVQWVDIDANPRQTFRGKTRGTFEPNEGVRPVYGYLVYVPSVDPLADQSSGFIAAFEEEDDANHFKDLLIRIRDLTRTINDLSQPAN